MFPFTYSVCKTPKTNKYKLLKHAVYNKIQISTVKLF